MNVTLRPYQEKAVADLRAAYAEGCRAPLLCSSTGSGKTVIFSAVASGAQGRGKRVLILAHRRELIRQASAKLSDAGVSHGVIAPGFTPSNDLVQVGSVQTVVRRLDRVPAFDLIVVDEAHHAPCGQYLKIIAAQPQARLLGVTATPERMDGRGLGRNSGGVFDRLVMGPSVAELIEDKFLTPARVFAPAEAPDLSGVRTKMGDYEMRGLQDAMDVPTLTGDAVAHYAKHAPGQPAIAFCISVEHARNVAATFRAAGWRSVCAHGGMAAAERDAALAGLATGQVQILTACEIVSEGLDVPTIGAVILLRPTKSLGLHLQQVGRGLRPALGKTHLTVLDHAGNTIKHGLPETPHAWSLDGRPKRQAAPPTRQCPSCFAIHAPAPACPACGHSYAVANDGGGREIQQRDGELAEINAERLARLRGLPLHELLTGRESLAELEEIRKARGYARGWVFYVMQDRKKRVRAAA